MLNIRRPKISIIMPVWNERKTVETAVRRIHALEIDKEIIVIDDFSTDGSREILKQLQSELKLKLILHAKNKGKGAAVAIGASHAKGEYMIVEDADSELDPNDIPRMLESIEEDPVDMILGKRLLRQNVNKVTKIGRFITTALLKILYGKAVSDPLCAYKMCKLNKFKSLHIESQRFGVEIEWVTKAIEKQWTFREFEVDYFPRDKKEGKKINLGDGLDIIIKIIRLRFKI